MTGGQTTSAATNEPARPKDDYLLGLDDHPTLDHVRSALVVVDMQYATGSWDAGLGAIETAAGRAELVRWRFDRIDQVVIPSITRLLEAYRAASLPVIYVKTGSLTGDFTDIAPHYRRTQNHVNNRIGAREFDVRDEIAPREGDATVVKGTISAFKSTGIANLLRAKGVEVGVFCGISTNMCVDSTARDAAELGFGAVMIHDACSAAKAEYHDAALVTFQRLFGRSLETDEVLAELARA